MSFSVPEQYRITMGPLGSTVEAGNNGAFRIHQGRKDPVLFAIASNGAGWEHVSVSLVSKDRLPTWDEMCLVKDFFWGAEDTVVQFHPPKSEYIDNAPVLHLWRRHGEEFVLPPSILVGLK